MSTKISNYIAGRNKKFRLKDSPTCPDVKMTKSEGEKKTDKNINEMIELQDVFYASQKRSLLIIFQALDAAGKDGTIKHVMSGLNPQGTVVQRLSGKLPERTPGNTLCYFNQKTPWYVIPSDKKWLTRLLVLEIIVKKLKEFNLACPASGKSKWINLRNTGKF